MQMLKNGVSPPLLLLLSSSSPPLLFDMVFVVKLTGCQLEHGSLALEIEPKRNRRMAILLKTIYCHGLLGPQQIHGVRGRVSIRRSCTVSAFTESVNWRFVVNSWARAEPAAVQPGTV